MTSPVIPRGRHSCPVARSMNLILLSTSGTTSATAITLPVVDNAGAVRKPSSACTDSNCWPDVARQTLRRPGCPVIRNCPSTSKASSRGPGSTGMRAVTVPLPVSHTCRNPWLSSLALTDAALRPSGLSATSTSDVGLGSATRMALPGTSSTA